MQNCPTITLHDRERFPLSGTKTEALDPVFAKKLGDILQKIFFFVDAHCTRFEYDIRKICVIYEGVCIVSKAISRNGSALGARVLRNF